MRRGLKEKSQLSSKPNYKLQQGWFFIIPTLCSQLINLPWWHLIKPDAAEKSWQTLLGSIQLRNAWSRSADVGSEKLYVWGYGLMCHVRFLVLDLSNLQYPMCFVCATKMCRRSIRPLMLEYASKKHMKTSVYMTAMVPQTIEFLPAMVFMTHSTIRKPAQEHIQYRTINTLCPTWVLLTCWSVTDSL